MPAASRLLLLLLLCLADLCLRGCACCCCHALLLWVMPGELAVPDSSVSAADVEGQQQPWLGLHGCRWWLLL
jgi:hypothetical protein